eukprot:Gb_31579 [translate_table: standard]
MKSVGGKIGNAISGGKLNLQVFFYGVPVHSESHDLCSKTSCPVKQGNFMLTNTQSLPGFTPPLKIVGVCINVEKGFLGGRLGSTMIDHKMEGCCGVECAIVLY